MPPRSSELNTVIVPFVVKMLGLVPQIAHSLDYEPENLQGTEIPTTLKDGEGALNYASVQCDSTQEQYVTPEQCDLLHDLCIRLTKQVVVPARDQPAMQALLSTLADLFRGVVAVGDSPTHKLLGPAQTPVRAQRRILQETWTIYYSELRFRALERVTLPPA